MPQHGQLHKCQFHSRSILNKDIFWRQLKKGYYWDILCSWKNFSGFQCRLECKSGFIAQRTPVINCVDGVYAQGVIIRSISEIFLVGFVQILHIQYFGRKWKNTLKDGCPSQDLVPWKSLTNFECLFRSVFTGPPCWVQKWKICQWDNISYWSIKLLNSIDSMQLNRSIPASMPPALLYRVIFLTGPPLNLLSVGQ